MSLLLPVAADIYNKVMRALLFSTLVLLSVSACVSGQHDAERSNLSGIQKLHQADITATLHANPAELAALWDDNGVLLGQGEQPVIGKVNLRKSYESDHSRVLEYTPLIRDIQITGNTAVEWGSFDAVFSLGDEKKTLKLHARFLRTMKKEDDGNWKFTRVMWQDMNN